MTPAARREAAEFAHRQYEVSVRRACGLTGCPKSSFYYAAKGREDEALRNALKEKAENHLRWGYRTLAHIMRTREGWKDNHKRIYRVYAEAGLQIGKRRRRPKAKYRGEALEKPERANELWVMDFMSDQLADGRRIRLFTIIDVFTRQCLAVEIDSSLGGERVKRVLERLVAEWGKPERLGSDNGPEFRGKVLDQWAYDTGVKLQFIPPGKPTKNAYIESFNALFRDDCLNQHYFHSLEDARRIVREWIVTYNTVRPHGSLGMETPAEYAAAQGRLRSSRQGGTPSAAPGQKQAPNEPGD